MLKRLTGQERLGGKARGRIPGANAVASDSVFLGETKYKGW